MKMASFLAGFGGGYLKAKDKAAQDERQARLDAQATEMHNARMSEISDAQSERQRERDYRGAIESALSAGKTDAGFQVTDAAGSNAFTKDQDAAGVLADMAGTINGGASTAAATRVSTGMQGATQRGTIPGQQVFTDPTKAQDFAQSTKMSDYAKLKARQDVAEQYAKLDIADDMRAKLENLAQKGVFQAYQHLDAGNAEGALKVLQNANPNLVPANAVFKQVDVPDMFDRTKTVKGWSLVAPGVEGKPERVVVGDFRDAVFGYLSPEKQFDIKHKIADTDLQNRKVDATEKKTEAYMQSLLGRASGGGSGGGRAAGSQAAAGGLPSPMEGFDSKKAYAIATEQAATELSQPGEKPPSGQAIAKRATEIYRALEGEFQRTGTAQMASQAFANSAARITTPAEMQTLFQQGQAAGLAPAQMAAIDPRFAQLAQPKQQPGQTVKNPLAADAPTEPPAKPKPEKPQPNFMTRMFPQARIKNLETMAARNMASKAELQELQELKAMQGKEWWRGRASDASY